MYAHVIFVMRIVNMVVQEQDQLRARRHLMTPVPILAAASRLVAISTISAQVSVCQHAPSILILTLLGFVVHVIQLGVVDARARILINAITQHALCWVLMAVALQPAAQMNICQRTPVGNAYAWPVTQSVKTQAPVQVALALVPTLAMHAEISLTTVVVTAHAPDMWTMETA